MAKKIRLEAVGHFEGEGSEVSESVYERPVMMVYTGTFDSMDGEVTIDPTHIILMERNHNSFFSKLKRLATGDVPMKDCPPLQLDHSVSARDTIGRLVGELRSGDVDIDGEKRLALFGIARFLGKENVEKAKDGRYTHVSIGADLEDGKINELSVTPFPAAPNASLLKAKLGLPQEAFKGHILSWANDQGIIVDSRGQEWKASSDSIKSGKPRKGIPVYFEPNASDKKRAQNVVCILSAKLAAYKGVDYEVKEIESGEYEIYVAGKKVSVHAGTPEEVDAEAKRYIDDEKKEIGMHDKLKKHLMDKKKLSEHEAEKLAGEVAKHAMSKMGADEEKMSKHLAEADDKEMSRMSDEHDAHMKHLAEKEDEDKKKLSDDKASEADKKLARKNSFLRLAKRLGTDVISLSVDLRASTVRARLSKLRSQGRLTPAEIRKIDIVKLSNLSTKELDAAMGAFDILEERVKLGSMSGTTKAESVEKITKKYRMQKMELESRMNMPSKRMAAQAEFARLAEAEKKELEAAGEEKEPSKGMLTKLTYDEMCHMLEDTKRHDELKRHLKHMSEHYGEEMESADHDEKQMSAIAKKQIELQTNLEQLISLASPALDISSVELKQ